MKIDPFVFFIAFAVGMFFSYIHKPTPQIVYKMPTPDNAGKIIYKDKDGTCYKYKAYQVGCSDKSKNTPSNVV